MSPDLTPEQRYQKELQSWEELSCRLNRAASQSGVALAEGGDLTLSLFSIPKSDPDGVIEFLEARRASAISRWDRLVATYPFRHYVDAEVAGLGMFRPEGRARQIELDKQVDKVCKWLAANLKEGADFEIEGSGVSSDFHIFFRSAESYRRFCAATGETERVQDEFRKD